MRAVQFSRSGLAELFNLTVRGTTGKLVLVS